MKRQNPSAMTYTYFLSMDGTSPDDPQVLTGQVSAPDEFQAVVQAIAVSNPAPAYSKATLRWAEHGLSYHESHFAIMPSDHTNNEWDVQLLD